MRAPAWPVQDQRLHDILDQQTMCLLRIAVALEKIAAALGECERGARP